MNDIDYDDPDVEEHWCLARRIEVERYLASRPIAYGEVGEWPAWHLAPDVSIWAVESAENPGWVGWWVVCGDIPTDYISAVTLRHPRPALRAIGERWIRMLNGEPVSEGHVTKELLPLLASRAYLLGKFADDDRLWGPEYDCLERYDESSEQAIHAFTPGAAVAPPDRPQRHH